MPGKSAATLAVIERKFVGAGLWCFAAAGLSMLGLMHSYQFASGDTVMALGEPAWKWAAGYAMMGAAFITAHWLTVPADAGH